MTVPFRPRPSAGALEAQVDRVLPAYQAHLNDQGCGASFCSALTGTARHMIAWLAINGSDVTELDIRSVGDFLSHDCDCPAEFRSQLEAPSRWHAHRVLGDWLETGQTAVPPAIFTGGRLVEAFAGTLTAQGYRESTRHAYAARCRHLIVWLYLQDLALAEFDGGVLQRFVDHDCACEHPHFYSRPSAFSGSHHKNRGPLAKFARFLIDQGETADWRDPVRPGHRTALLDAYLDWLSRHRGFRESTLTRYDRNLRALLPSLGADPATYSAASIRQVMLLRAQSHSGGSFAQQSCVLRAYLRFLASQGLCRPGLAEAIPSCRRRTAAPLPRYVEPDAIEALIASCDTTTPTGLRDRAVLLLLARLALRPGDIAALQLADIDWERAAVTVGGKSRRSAALPLPQEAGDALKDYILQARPRTACPAVFRHSRAPYSPLSSPAVSAIARRAIKRTGINGDRLPAAYLFRHSRATHLLRDGTSPEAVGTLLRHQSVQTTALYARVDVPMLLAVAQPWPGEL